MNSEIVPNFRNLKFCLSKYKYTHIQSSTPSRPDSERLFILSRGHRNRGAALSTLSRYQ